MCATSVWSSSADYEKIEEGQSSTRTGEVLSVPVGDAFLGGSSTRLATRWTGRARSRPPSAARELQAPSGGAAAGVTEALQTGIKAIDALTRSAGASPADHR